MEVGASQTVLRILAQPDRKFKTKVPECNAAQTWVLRLSRPPEKRRGKRREKGMGENRRKEEEGIEKAAAKEGCGSEGRKGMGRREERMEEEGREEEKKGWDEQDRG